MKLAYTLPEAAEACGVSEDTLKKAIRKGTLKGKRSGREGDRPDGEGVGKYIVTTSALNAWLEQLADA